ncbi:hypothetical protein J1N35_038205 [Gossypium stocksii]|uniref:Reverse transcriptase domain-containing protein n=1 Tax=Gossypium stocksii TaxID=47602 RepID=A0A9D3ULI4_9ROSI|nr:hypothetical protein J1N35_038205 [Gossypium stocksii]
MIHNNILITHELVHYLQNTKNGPNKGFAIKLDMSKAYDRVEWNFIEKVMCKMGYTDKWVKKIMCCIRSVRYVVKCNSTLLETNVPEKGSKPRGPSLFLSLSILRRQVWRLINFKDTLCFKVLSTKYFPDGDVFRPKYCNRPSFTWTSIAKAAIALKERVKSSGKGIGSLSFMVLKWGSAFAIYPFLLLMSMIAERGYTILIESTHRNPPILGFL